MNIFQTSLAHIFAQEGGYSDHPHDPGGATNFGITRATLARFRKVRPPAKLPKSAVRRLGKAEAARIYYRYYWAPLWAKKMPPGIALCLFDFAVNSGPYRAIKTLQSIVQAPRDGRMGPVTLAAMKTFIASKTEAKLIDTICAARLRFLKRLRHYPTFGRGWRRRVERTRNKAQKLVKIHSQKTNGAHQKMTYLKGYKTYVTALLMLLVGLAQLAGVDVPAFEHANAGQLMMEAFAIIFLRKGLKDSALNVD